MATTPRLELVRWQYRYMDWARAALLAAVAELDAATLARPGVIAGGNGDGSVLAALVHLCDGEEVWLAQWTGTPATFAWGAPTSLPALVARWAGVAERRATWLAGLTDADLDGAAPLRRGAIGEPVAVPLWQRLLHLADHTATHRGEVCAALTALGAPPPEIDPFLYAVSPAGQG